MIKSWQERVRPNASLGEQHPAMQAEIDELRAENAALLAANLDCVDHYTQLRADFAALKKGHTREQIGLQLDDMREGLGAHHVYCRVVSEDV